MARFSLSIMGRKKQPVQPTASLPPASKAHKILGSTPLSIDVAAGWDDMPSFPTTGHTSSSTGSTGSELDLPIDGYNNRRVTPTADEVWGEESDIIISHRLPLDADERWNPPEMAPTVTAEQLRKSRSSSTIRSWYDESKVPLSISQQTSSSAMAKVFRSCTPLGIGIFHEGAEMTKNESPRMSSHTMPQEHDTPENDLSTTSGMDRLLKSPSMFSSLTSLSTRSRESRERRKKRNKDNAKVVVSEAPQSSGKGAVRLEHGKPKHSPCLYSHYEQIPLRHIIRQGSTPDLEATEHARPMSHQTKSSRNADQSLEGKNLLHDSVLMLSSDSEDDANSNDDDQNLEGLGFPAISQRPASSRSREQLKAAKIVDARAELRLRTTREAEPSASDGTNRPRRQGNRTSFASSDSHVTLPSPESRRSAPDSIASRSTNPRSDQTPDMASSRSSVMSDRSTSSALTWQDESEFEIQEATAISMMTARQISEFDIQDRIKAFPTPHRASLEGQLTPPLSPSSVDFCMRPLHSSIDSLASPSRLMTVTEQEEILITAIRHKQQTRRQASVSAPLVSEEDEQDMTTREKKEKRSSTSPLSELSSFQDYSEGPRRKIYTVAKGQCSKVVQANTPKATIDFGFPAPPSFRPNSNLRQGRPTDAKKPVISPIRTSGHGHGAVALPSSPSGPPPTISLPALPKVRRRTRPSSNARESLSTPIQQQYVPLFYDDAEPSPDLEDIREWEAATSPFENQEKDKSGLPSKADSPTFLDSKSYSMPNGKSHVLSQSQKDMEEDIPRPDSPISPEPFLTTLKYTAPLSAVRSGA